MRGIITMLAVMLVTMPLAAPAAAIPVSDTNSESPFIDAFYHRLDRLGYGYLDPAWKVMDAAWVACGLKDVPGSNFTDVAAVVQGRGYNVDEATAIAQAATTHLCQQ